MAADQAGRDGTPALCSDSRPTYEELLARVAQLEQQLASQDRTERQQAEAGLRAAEERHRLALAAGCMATWDWNLRTGEVAWNDEHFHILGYQPGSVQPSYQAWAQRVHSADWAATDAVLQASLKQGGEYRAEYRVVWPDGTVHWLECRGRVERDREGQPSRQYGVMLDITERKRTEAALREDEERFRKGSEELAALVDGLPAYVWFGDADCRVISGNRAANAMLGVADGANISQTAVAEGRAVYIKQLKADGTEYTPEELPMQRAVATGQPVRDAFIEFIFPDGRQVQTLGNATPLFDAHGTVRGTVAAFFDISKLKRAEEAAAQSQRTFTELVERAPFGMYIVDSGFRVAYMNSGSQAKAFRNVRPIIGRPFNEVMHTLWSDPVAEEILGYFRHTLQTGEPYFSPRFVNRRVDIDIVEGYEWELHRVTLPDGQHGVICYYFDSTQIRAAEADLRRFAEELDLERGRLHAAVADLSEADRRKNEFLAVLSHELRNPLAPICNSLHVMARAQPGGEHAKRAQAVIERQVSQLTRLVDDLLDATRIASGKLQMCHERLELGELVRRAVEDHRAAFASAGVELKASVTTRPAWLHGDPTRLSQMIGNLLQNAAKFTPRAGRVEVTLWVEDGRASLRVQDTGMGIAPDMLTRLFQPFAQAEQAIDRRYGGLGLGLALAKTVVDAHGGGIEAHSEGLGRGASFTVRLPIEAATIRESPTAVSPLLRPRRILVVEDNVDAANSLREILELGGHRLAVAYDGAEAITKAREFLPEVVLCDIGLPGLDGYAVARALRADQALRGVFLVAISGYALPEDIAKATEAGFDRHLAKPIDPESLERVLAAEVGGRDQPVDPRA